MAEFDQVIADLEAVVGKITQNEKSSKFTSFLNEELQAISTSVLALERVDSKLSKMIFEFVKKLETCNAQLATEKSEKDEKILEAQTLKMEIDNMKTSAQIASAKTEEERKQLISEHEEEVKKNIEESEKLLLESDADIKKLVLQKEQLENQLEELVKRKNIELGEQEAYFEQEKDKSNQQIALTLIRSKDQQRDEELNEMRLKNIQDNTDKDQQRDEELNRMRLENIQDNINKDQQRDMKISLEQARLLQVTEESQKKVEIIREKLNEKRLQLEDTQNEKIMLLAQKAANEEQIQKLNEISSMSQQELEAFKVKNNQDLLTSKEEMDALNEKIRVLDSDVKAKEKSLNEGTVAIRKLVGLLQKFVSDDDNSGYDSKSQEIKNKVKNLTDVISKIEKQIDENMGIEGNPISTQPDNIVTNDITPDNTKGTITKEILLDRVVEPERVDESNPDGWTEVRGKKNKKKGGTRKRRQSRKRKSIKRRRLSTKLKKNRDSRRTTRRRNNQKKRVTRRRKRRKQSGGFTYKN
jgi:hypothetical protein